MDNQEKQVINQAENQPKKPGRGGKRPGAGRPKGDGTSKLYAFRADKEVAAYLDCQENKTDFIKECIIRQMEVAKSRQEDEALMQLGEVMPTSRIKPMTLPVCDLNGEYTLQRVCRKGGTLWLVPANPEYPEIEITEGDDFSVWGVVTYIIHKPIF